METINQRIEKIIRDSGMSASEFAEKLGVQRSSISHLLSGRNKPSIDFIHKLVEAFPETDVNQLITGNPPMSKPEPSPSGRSNTIGEHLGNEKKEGNSLQSGITNVNSKSSFEKVKPVNTISSSSEGKTDQIDRSLALPVSGSIRVRKIILLYEDGRFQEFTP